MVYYTVRGNQVLPCNVWNPKGCTKNCNDAGVRCNTWKRSAIFNQPHGVIHGGI
ncbi:hypothetical protein NUACC26_093690 [Scytonema sp. NUACC26]